MTKTKLIHVLGSDIPHHNQTILNFFNNSLAQYNIHARDFMVVGKDIKHTTDFPALTVSFWPEKASLARAVVKKAKTNRQQRFFFHGQFNSWLWLALLNDDIHPVQFNWHIWGADLYEVSHNWKFRLLYFIRRMAHRRVSCVFASRGDLNYFKQYHPNVRSELLYFPTRMNCSTLNKTINDNKSPTEKLTILVGNSGSCSNEHAAALKEIYQKFGNTVNIILPMGYPTNHKRYINKIRKIGHALFGKDNFQILDKRVEFDDYSALLRKCDLGYLVSLHQQGIGTLCLLIQAGVPCVLNRKNPFLQDLAEQRIPILFTSDTLNKAIVRETQRKLSLVEKHKIIFFSPNYTNLWYKALRTAVGEKA